MDTLIFTLAEARAMLPQVRTLIDGIRRKKRKIAELRTLLDAIRRSTGADGTAISTNSGPVKARAQALIDDLRREIHELQSLGIQIKDLDRGLVDWTALRDGEHVYLCWQSGEANVDWWHSIAEGFAGRRPIVNEEWD